MIQMCVFSWKKINERRKERGFPIVCYGVWSGFIYAASKSLLDCSFSLLKKQRKVIRVTYGIKDTHAFNSHEKSTKLTWKCA